MEAKPKQEPLDPQEAPREKNPDVMPASPVESSISTKHLFAGFVIESADHRPVWKIDPQRTIRKVPDIKELASIGGLSESVKPYKLGIGDGYLSSAMNGESTATVNRAVILGCSRMVETARDLVAQDGSLSASDIVDRVDHMQHVDPRWVEQNILRGDRSSEDLGEELCNTLIAGIPTVSKWGMAPTLEPGRGKLSTAELAKYIEKHRVRFCGEWQGWDKLTVLQLQAASLRWECKCSVSKIAELLGVTRKSVDDRLHGADQKITAASGASRNDKKKAKRGSDY